MSSTQFRDALALRYGRTPTNLSTHCDADGEEFTVCHALNCKKGGLVTLRHNELRDLNIEMVKSAGFTYTVKEPSVKDSDVKGEGGLRVDWGVRGFWEHQREALFDCRIFNADAISYVNTPINTLLEKHRNEKKQQYNEAVEDRRGTFTPFVATCDAILDIEAEHYLKRLSSHLAEKWGKSYSVVIGWVRARIPVCILRSVSVCLRGSRIKMDI